VNYLFGWHLCICELLMCGCERAVIYVSSSYFYISNTFVSMISDKSFQEVRGTLQDYGLTLTAHYWRRVTDHIIDKTEPSLQYYNYCPLASDKKGFVFFLFPHLCLLQASYPHLSAAHCPQLSTKSLESAEASAIRHPNSMEETTIFTILCAWRETKATKGSQWDKLFTLWQVPFPISSWFCNSRTK